MEDMIARFTRRQASRMRRLENFPDGEYVRIVSVEGNRAVVTRPDWGYQMKIRINPPGSIVSPGEELPMWAMQGDRQRWYIRGRWKEKYRGSDLPSAVGFAPDTKWRRGFVRLDGRRLSESFNPIMELDTLE